MKKIMKQEKYNPIKTIRVYCAIQGRNSLPTEPLYRFGNENGKDRRWMEVYAVFPSKKNAKEWIRHWKNSEDFTIVESEIKIPEAN